MTRIVWPTAFVASAMEERPTCPWLDLVVAFVANDREVQWLEAERRRDAHSLSMMHM
jgi:hypothetical protein